MRANNSSFASKHELEAQILHTQNAGMQYMEEILACFICRATCNFLWKHYVSIALAIFSRCVLLLRTKSLWFIFAELVEDVLHIGDKIVIFKILLHLKEPGFYCTVIARVRVDVSTNQLESILQ